jgi:putative aldouronate transport system permease protein
MVKTTSSKVADLFVAFLCFLLILICLLPMVNLASRSLSSADALVRNEVTFYPIGLNFNAYATIFKDAKYTVSLGWTAILTVICTLLSLFMTIICAYPLTYKQMKGRNFFNTMIILTMYFNAGMIPNYLLFKDLNLLDNPLVMIVPGCLSVFNMIILRSFFYGIPESLRESAEIDGAGPIRILVSIYLPLSTSVLATLALFYAVGRWNGYTDALFYMINEKQYHPIQLLLYNIINNISAIEGAKTEGYTTPGLSETLKSATIMFATIPILVVYPWLQRYFIAGVTLGAVKG